jgi:hypothetical protein
MKFGTYVFEPKKAEGFDFHLFRVKPEVGRRLPPMSDMYSKNYVTPWYWEMLTRGLKKLFKDVKLNIALYVFGPGDNPTEVPAPSELVMISVRAGRAGADGILYLTDKASQIWDFQKAVVDRVKLRQKLKTYGCQEILDYFQSWKKVVE